MTIENEDDVDAAQAFVELRAEVTVMRRAVEGLPGVISSLEPPDYSPSFGAIGKALANVEERLANIEGHSALQMTPAHYSSAMQAAGSPIIDTAVSAVNLSAAKLAQAGREVASVVANERNYQDQNRALRWAVGAGIAAGLVLYPILGTFAPGGSYLGAWATGNSDRWSAGYDLMQTANPFGAESVTNATQLVDANIKAVNACLAAAKKARMKQKCTIEVSPSMQ